MKRRTTWSCTGAVIATSALGALLAAMACSSSSSTPAVSVGGGAGGQCATSPGTYPIANCVPYPPDAQACNSPALNCPTTPCTASSPCLAMGADNSSASTASLRIRKLNVTAPPALATAFVQKAVIDQGINLHNQCGEAGDGTFSWLIQVDPTTHKVTTGGAAPTTDPFGTGYCFVNTNIEGLAVQPVTVDTIANADGSFTSAVLPKLYVPIFIVATQMNAMGKSVIVLPLTNAKVENVTLSENNNCIGNYNADAIDQVTGTTCYDDPTSCVRWTTAGSLGGYITLAEADLVFVPQLSESLCVLLTGGALVDTSNPNEKTCKKDSSGNILSKGDFCSTSQKAGGCQDSFWLAATFAASAAKIVAANQPSCMGAPIGDAGGQ